MGQNQMKNPRTMFPYTLFCMAGGGGGGRGEGKEKINGMTLTKFNACMAVDQLLQYSLDRAAGNDPTTSTLEQEFFHLQSKSYTFKIMVRPTIVWLRFFLNGQTNLALLPPPLLEVHGALCHKNNFI